MSYKIVITKVETVSKMRRGEWVVQEMRPMTQKEYLDSCDPFVHHFKSDQPDADLDKLMKAVYGYAPDRAVDEEKETKVYEQIVEELHLPAVINAVNQIDQLKAIPIYYERLD